MDNKKPYTKNQSRLKSACRNPANSTHKYPKTSDKLKHEIDMFLFVQICENMSTHDFSGESCVKDGKV